MSKEYTLSLDPDENGHWGATLNRSLGTAEGEHLHIMHDKPLGVIMREMQIRILRDHKGQLASDVLAAATEQQADLNEPDAEEGI